MDGHAELQESQRRVVPMAGAAVKLSFATLSGYPLLVTLKGNDAFAPGEVVKDDRGNVVGMTGQGNQLYARVAAQSGALQVNDCRLPYSIDDEQRQAPLIALTLACQQEGKK
jgi:outer membrane usher protein